MIDDKPVKWEIAVLPTADSPAPKFTPPENWEFVIEDGQPYILVRDFVMGIEQPLTEVRTVIELNALPPCTVIRSDRDETVYEKQREKQLGREWMCIGWELDIDTANVALPARVLFIP